MTDREARLARLAQATRARRLALGLAVQHVAKLARVDRATWIKMEAGERELMAHTAAKVERALRWAPESIDAILAGGEPTELPSLPVEPKAAQDPAPPEPSLEQEIARLYALRDAGRLTPRQLRAALRALIDFYAEDIDEDASGRPTA